MSYMILRGTQTGQIPGSLSQLDDVSATKMGMKSYQHGTTYNGGIAPTITLTAGGGTLNSVGYSSFIPYQLQDGTWRMKFSFVVTLSSATRTGADFAVNGVTYSNSNVSCSGGNVGVSVTTYALTTSTNIILGYNSASTTAHTMSGDVPLTAKPTWAY